MANVLETPRVPSDCHPLENETPKSPWLPRSLPPKPRVAYCTVRGITFSLRATPEAGGEPGELGGAERLAGPWRRRPAFHLRDVAGASCACVSACVHLCVCL